MKHLKYFERKKESKTIYNIGDYIEVVIFTDDLTTPSYEIARICSIIRQHEYEVKFDDNEKIEISIEDITRKLSELEVAALKYNL